MGMPEQLEVGRPRRDGDPGHVARADRRPASATSRRREGLRRPRRAPRGLVPVDHRSSPDDRSGRRRGRALVRGRRLVAPAAGGPDRRDRADRRAPDAAMAGDLARRLLGHLDRGCRCSPSWHPSSSHGSPLRTSPSPASPARSVGWAWIAFRVAIFGAAIAVGRARDPRRRAGSRSAAAAPGHPARPRRRHGRWRAADRATVLGQRPVDRRVDRHAVRRARLVRRLRAGHLLRARDRRARLPPLGAGRAWGSRSTSASSSASTASSGGCWRSTSRSSSAWRWWRRWPSSSRRRRGCGAGWAPATETRPTTGCSAPSARAC